LVPGKRCPGPRQTIRVLEVRGDGTCRAVFAERAAVEGRCPAVSGGRIYVRTEKHLFCIGKEGER
jgi:hypothetical protein